ncbi:MAG: hypothetical protein ACI4EK_03020 [Wujia sp.]
MQKIVWKMLVFIAVAVGTAFFVNQLNNRGLDAVSRELEEPTLPLMYVNFNGTIINRTSGYTQTMSTSLMRDGIIPLDENHGVTLLLEDSESVGETYTYELRSIAGDSLIERGEAIAGSSQNGRRTFTIQFRMDMRENTEYVLVFIVTTKDKQEIRYYNRVVSLSKQFASEILDFSWEFHNTTFVKEFSEAEGNLVSENLKTATVGTTSDLSHVNLNSTYNQISWGDMNPIVVTSVVPTLTEIDRDYAVIRMSYVVETMHNRISHFYHVSEYYNATFEESSEATKLLAFDRYIESYFDTGYINKERNCLSMGVTGQRIEYTTTQDYKKLAFVRMGQLWLYDYGKTSLTNVFSFSQDSYSDVRTLNPNLDINIADMDEDGNIYFVVYGYMARGSHEGRNGISLYYYDAKESKTTEKFFVQCDESYDIMKEETGRFTYYNKDENTLYYLLDEAIYAVNVETHTQTILTQGIPSAKYLVSENHKVVAYPNHASDEQVTALTIRDFETGEVFEKTGETDDLFLALGFVENDLIYGICKQEDVIITSDGEAILPLYKLFIMNEDGKQLKEYAKDNLYIMNASVGEDTIYLSRAKKQNRFFEETDEDYISYKRETSKDMLTVQTSFDTYAWNVTDMVFPENFYLSDSAKYRKTKYSRDEAYEELLVETKTREDAYYVFDNSGFAGEYRTAGSAITHVVEATSGLVVDSNGNAVYRCVVADSYNTVANQIQETPCVSAQYSLLTCAYMCAEYAGATASLQDILACESWEEVFSTYTIGVGINISGITLDTALYFLDRDIPFAAQIDDGRFVLVISYNSGHIRYYDPILDEEVKCTRDTFEYEMSKQGNTMYTFSTQ